MISDPSGHTARRAGSLNPDDFRRPLSARPGHARASCGMTADRADDVRRAGARRRRVSAGVLADRMAAALVHHEPGWRLPRLTAMARRFNVSAAEVDAAIDDLAARHLLRRLPDGQVYRASPAEYRVPLEGLSGLTSHVDPMGGQLVCKSRQVSRRRPPEDIGRSLGLGAGEPVLAIRCVWTVGAAAGGAGSPAREAGPAGPAPPPVAAQARALQIELAPPPPSVARSLRLAAGEQVAMVTVSFEDPATHRPVAITTAMLRPDLFRIVIQAAAGPDGRAGGFASVWTHAAAGWEP